MFGVNAATSGVAVNAQVNQRAADLWAPADLADQDVIIGAIGHVDSVNYAGNPSVLNFISDESELGAGGFFDAILLQNSAIAYIDDMAEVFAGRDVNIEATTETHLVTVVFAGNYAEKTAIDGAIVWNRVKHTTIAQIEERAIVEAGRDVNLTAQSDPSVISIAPALAIGGEKGIGISLTFTSIKDVTRAFIGDRIDDIALGGYGGVTGKVKAGRDIDIYARSSPVAWAIAAAGGVASGTDNGGAGQGQTASVGAPSNSNPSDLGSAGADGGVGGGFGIGVSGSVAFNLIEQRTVAAINDNAVVEAGGNIELEAFSDPLLVNIAGGVAFGDDALAVGAAYGHNQLTQTTTAFIGDALVIRVTNVDIYAHSDNDIIGIAATGAFASDDSGLAGGVGFTGLTIDTFAALANEVELTDAVDLRIEATNDTSLLPITAAVGGSTDLALGVNVALVFIDTDVKAWISGDATVALTGDAKVFAGNSTDIIGVAASLGVSTDSSALAGSASAISLDHDVQAFIGAGTGSVSADGSIFLDADDFVDLIVLAGQVAGGSDSGFGASVAYVSVNRTVLVYIAADARVTALGQGAGLLDPGATGYGGAGLTLDASAKDTLLVVAAGGSGGDEVGFAASAVITVVTSTVEAYIGQRAIVNDDNTGAATGQSVRLRGDHDLTVIDVAGVLAIGDTAAIGLGVDVQVLDTHTRAYVDEDAEITAARDVLIEAASSQDLLSIAVAGTYSGSANIAGSVNVLVLDPTTQARIGDGATVVAAGSVLVAAHNHADIDTFAGVANISGGGSASIGASVSTIIRTEITTAYIDDDAAVTALGQGAAIFVPNGTFNSVGDPNLVAFHGLAVVASSYENIDTLAIGAAGGAEVAIGGSVTVNTLNDTTTAYIGDRVTVNGDNTGAGASQDVLVRAADKTDLLGLAGALQIGSSLGLGIGTDVAILTKNTTAYIGRSTTLNVARHVTVDARSVEDVISVTANIGASTSSAGIAASVSVYVVNTTTRAYLDGGLAFGVTINAGGDVNVTADDTSDYLLIAGSVGAASSAGIGVSNTTLVRTDIVEAWIGDDATITSGGNPGVTVSATSSEDIITIAAAGGGASTAAVAGSGAVNVLEDVTRAWIGRYTNIVADNAAPGIAPGVTVTAVDTTAIVSVAGSLAAAGTAAVGVGADVADLEKLTEAFIDSGVTIDAEGDISVIRHR